jgi:hypothetical protein
MLLPASWILDGCAFKLKRGSNTSSQLYTSQRVKIGEIHQSCRHWDVSYDLVRYELVQLKRGDVLKSSIGMIATIKTNGVGRVICTYNEDKHVPLALLLYVTIYYRISLDSGSS